MGVQRLTAVLGSLFFCFASAHAQQGPQALQGPEPQQRSTLRPGRVFIDPISGQRWRFTPDPEHPAAPWLAVIDTGCSSCGRAEPQHSPLIHGGEPVVVWRAGASGVFRLRGVALNAAVQGGDVRVKLASGTAICGIVSAPGEVRFEGRDRRQGWGTDEP